MTPLTIIILTAILASLTYAGCNARNYYKRAKLRAYDRPEPVFESYKPPLIHTIMWVRDWIIFIVILSLIIFFLFFK